MACPLVRGARAGGATRRLNRIGGAARASRVRAHGAAVRPRGQRRGGLHGPPSGAQRGRRRARAASAETRSTPGAPAPAGARGGRGGHAGGSLRGGGPPARGSSENQQGPPRGSAPLHPQSIASSAVTARQAEASETARHCQCARGQAPARRARGQRSRRHASLPPHGRAAPLMASVPPAHLRCRPAFDGWLACAWLRGAAGGTCPGHASVAQPPVGRPMRRQSRHASRCRTQFRPS